MWNTENDDDEKTVTIGMYINIYVYYILLL